MTVVLGRVSIGRRWRVYLRGRSTPEGSQANCYESHASYPAR